MSKAKTMPRLGDRDVVALRKISDDIVKDALRASNPSGITPIEYKVLVRPRKVEERTKGGIVLPETVIEKDQHASMEGEVVAVSPLAFQYEDGAPKAEPRDTVIFARYAGINVKGNDGVDYRLMNDKDIVAVRRSA